MIETGNIHQFVDENTFNEQAAEYFVETLGNLINKRGEAYLAISGGSTPIPVFELIAHKYANALNWKGGHVFWVDERYVPSDSSESNFGNARRVLFEHLEGINLYRIKTELNPDLASEDYEKTIRNIVPQENGLPVFDLIWLGMGKDGHTASLFPGNNLLNQQKKWVGAAWVESQNSYRISLTFPVINKARQRMIAIKGPEKYNLFQKIRKLEQQKYPIQKISNSDANDHWFIKP